MTNDLKTYLKLSLDASIRAGSAILEIYDSGDWNVELKDDRSPLTSADKASHEIISSALSQTPFPILSEEGRSIPYDERKDWNPLWIVDPLDGTKEFLKRNGEFTVNIALVLDGTPICGVVYAPVIKEIFFGAQGLGSFKASNVGPESDAETIMATAQKLPLETERKTYVIMGSRSHATPELEAFVQKMREEKDTVEFVSAGSSLKICRVAEGAADMYPRLGPTMEWDTAAGHAVVVFAGKRFEEWESGRGLGYNKLDLLNPRFMVG
jgi:3'(2'), 5'-bisphosphate nucleotidase